MVLNTFSGSPVQEASTPEPAATGAANASQFQAGTFDGPFSPFGLFGRGGFRGMGHGRFLPETVPLEGGETDYRGPPHRYGPPPPFWGPHPDPLGPGFEGAGLTGLLGHHARNFAGDLATHFGGQPADGPMPGGPGFGPHGRDFAGWRGRRGGGRGGRGGMRGHWHGHHHGHHHGHGEFVHPRMDIFHSDNTYTVTIELPGLQKQNVDISATQGLLTISGEFASSNPPPADDPFAEYDTMDDEEGEEVVMEAAGNPNEGNGRYVLHERATGKFKRSLRLPGWVNLDSIKATMADGVLTIVFEKPQPDDAPAPSRKVSIA